MAELDQAPSPFWQAVRANHQLQHQSPAIKPGVHNGKIPLSFGQERLWWVEQLQPGLTAHHLRAVFRLQGRLDQPVLKKSLQEIADRHAILRTCFPASEGQPIQVILPALALELPVVDLGHLSPEEREAKARRQATAEAQRPFDLTQGPLFRLKLLRLAEDDYLLVRTIHHMISDRWSDSLFIGELARLYQAFAAGDPSPLPDLPIQYADFALFQRQWLQGDILKDHLDYWRRQLAGHPAPLNLPVETTSPTGPAYQGDTQYLSLPPDLTESLKRLSQQAGVSLFVVLLAAFKSWLARYSDQTEIMLCSPVAGRNRVETKKLIGYFNNLVLLRTSLAGNPDFREVISRVSQVTVGAFAHQDLPLQQIAEALNLPGSLLSRAMFALQNVPQPPQAMADVKITPLDIPEGIANFDLSLSMKIKDRRLLGVLRYKTDLFQAATAARLLADFQRLLQDLAAHPERRLSDLPRFSQTSSPQDVSRAVEAAVYVPPQSELEQTVAAIWQEALHLDRISVEANFFEIGGRSLTMVQIGHKVQDVLNLAVPVQELVKQLTIRRMAHYLSRQQAEKPVSPPAPQQRTQKQLEALRRQKQYMKLRRNLNG